MEILMVRIKVKSEHLDEFIVEMIGDAEGSVMNEPGCRRFDIVQDMDDPTMLALCEVYNDDDAIDDHRSRPHYARWRDTTAIGTPSRSRSPSASRCSRLATRSGTPTERTRCKTPHSNAGLHIIHAPLPIKPERVDDFIESLKGRCDRFDPRRAWVPEVRRLPERRQSGRTLPLRGVRKPGRVRLSREDAPHPGVAQDRGKLVFRRASRRPSRAEHLAAGQLELELRQAQPLVQAGRHGVDFRARPYFAAGECSAR